MNLTPAACFGLAPRPGALAPPEAELLDCAPPADSFDAVLSERASLATSGHDVEVSSSAGPTVDDLPATSESTSEEETTAEEQHEEESDSDEKGESELAASVIVAPSVVLSELPPADDTAEKLTAEAEPRINAAAQANNAGDQPLGGPSVAVIATDAALLSPTRERAALDKVTAGASPDEGSEAPSQLTPAGIRSAAERMSKANGDEAPSLEEGAATGTEVIAVLDSTAASPPANASESVIPAQTAAEPALSASFSSAATHSTPQPAHPWPAELVASLEREAVPAESTPADAARLIHRVARAFVTAQDGSGEVRLRLSPPELGALRLDVKVQGGALIARLETETSAARTTLIENLPALRERLAEQGMRIERFDVDLLPRQGGQFQRPADQQTPEQPSLVPRMRRLPQVAEGVVARAVMVGEPDLRRLNVIV